eukprot:8861311-Ditylum_brightwellii.AAC.1
MEAQTISVGYPKCANYGQKGDVETRDEEGVERHDEEEESSDDDENEHLSLVLAILTSQS